MVYKKNSLQTSCSSQPQALVSKLLAFACLPATALIMLTAYQSSAQAQHCASSYEPGTVQQRTKAGLLDGRVGPIKVVNNTETATIISLYHPDAPKRVFKYWYAEPGQSYLLGTDNYSGDWGIQVDEGPICLVGRVASWNGQMFTTFPSRLFIADAASTPAASTNAAISRSQTSLAVATPPLQSPETYEAIATKQITKGEARSGLISLLRAADLYRASGRLKEEERVRDRIKQIRNTGKESASKL